MCPKCGSEKECRVESYFNLNGDLIAYLYICVDCGRYEQVPLEES